MLAITAMLVASIGLSACAGAVPGAARLLSDLTASEQPVAQSVVQPIAQVQPSTVMLPTAQGVVAGDLQGKLQELYRKSAPQS